MKEMKIIDFETIKAMAPTPLQCYQWVEEGLKMKKDAFLPAKISMKPGIPGVFYNCMPSALPSLGYAGVKVANRYPDRSPSLDSQILLYDLCTGENVALLDGNWITTMRTGAVAAHSIHLFAKETFETLGFIGLGNTARATLQVLAELYPHTKFRIFLKKYKDQHDLFMESFQDHKNLSFQVCSSYEELIRNSEVIVSAVTVFDDDICQDEWFQEGCLLVPIHTRGFTNCDLFFDKIFADDTGHVKGFKNFSKFRSFAEVSDVISGGRKGRENDKERILAYNIGISLHDIYFASKIYEMAKGARDISLAPPKDKFWI